MRERLASCLALVLVLACGAEPARDPSVAITPIDVGALRLEHDGVGLRDRGRGPFVVHFWATWCVPCRRELPLLLEAARAQGVHDRVIALSTDAGWSPVRDFFGGAIPASVARDPEGALARTLGVSSLPDTYLIDAGGRATRRIAGARDWSLPEHRAWLSSLRHHEAPRATSR